MQVNSEHQPRRPRIATAAALAIAALAVLLSAPSALGAAPSQLWQVPDGETAPGSGAGQLNNPRGIGVDPGNGHVYVGESANARISEFSAWGQFVRAWGWDVAPDGAPGDTAADELEVCTTVCQAGVKGDGAGQLSGPRGVAVGPAGGVYVYEAPLGTPNKRVQKFSPTGEFLLMFGGEVDKTSGADVCGKADVEGGDECGAGVPGTGPGEFSSGSVGNYIAYSPTDNEILVGDKDRVQAFNLDGTYKDQIDFEGALAEFDEKEVGGLAVGPAGNLYLTFPFTDDVHEISADGSEVLGSFPVPAHTFGAVMAVAVDGEGNVYAVDNSESVSVRQFVRGYDAAGNQLLPTEEEEAPDFFPYNPFEGPSIIGLATNRCAGSEAPGNLYMSFSGTGGSDSHIDAYGPPPIGCEDPPDRAPIVAAQYTTAAGADQATVRAEVNPLFWPDTTYRVEYGTGKCSEGGCPDTAPVPAALLTEGVSNKVLKSAGVPLTGLAPSTTYRYRVVASSGGGGPEFGPRPIGEEAVEGAASFAAGREGSFTTLSSPTPQQPCPANEAFRTGPSAALPDCRAYELVSPLDKGNGDAALLPPTKLIELNQSALSGNGFTYTSMTPFAGPESSPFASQYLARREAGSGWSNEHISPPRTLSPLKGLGVTAALHNDFKAFSDDLCSSWLSVASSSTLAAGALPGWLNLYRRQGCAGAPSYEALTTTEPAGRPAGLFGQALNVMGHSADETVTAFLSDGALTEDAPPLNGELTSGGVPARLQLYVQGPGGLRFACHLPSGAPAAGPCGAGLSGPSPDGSNDGKGSAVQGALSGDGSRLYWTAYEGTPWLDPRPGRIYLTRNPDRPQSDQLHGSAAGKGDLTGPASCTGDTQDFSKTIDNVSCTVGFAAGQAISGDGIAAGTVVTEVLPGELKIDKRANATVTGSELSGPASAVIANLTTDFGEFRPEQQVTGPGIAAGTTIESCAPECGPGATSLTLSAAPSVSATGAALDASSECIPPEGEPEKACTTAVSAPVAGAAPAEYWGAAKDGSRAIFRVTEGPLSGNVYEYDAASDASSLIAAGALAPMGMSEDASRVYFASNEVLGEGAAEGAEEGAPNLYLYEAPAGGGEGSFDFIVGLAGSDLLGSDLRPATVSAVTTRRSSVVSPDGLHAAFGSSAPSPTGYENIDARSGELAEEVYRYDATTGNLVCASCNPSGARPSGIPVSEKGVSFSQPARLAPRRVPLHAPRSLSSDGSRLFFESRDKLVARDTNANWDVYQWEAAGKGSCTTSRPTYNLDSGGCVELISSGQTPSGASFLDADPSGSNVFIGTQASLVKADYGLNDVYVARVGGGFAEPEEPPAACQGEACQSPAAAPQAKTPASAAFHGAGNATEGRGCAPLARRLRTLAHRNRAMRHRARALARRGHRAPNPRQSRALRRRAH
ncbi:MAG TPA: hypothetical protein VFT19_13230, partial [Solirubrobacterales bacterium]|nr:hypothetical protein [Solirubrobacterales bacterium]